MKPSAAALRLASLLVVLFGVTVPGSLISPTPVAASSPSDWPTFLHDTSRSAATTDPNLSVANAGQLTLNWATPTGGIIEA